MAQTAPENSKLLVISFDDGDTPWVRREVRIHVFQPGMRTRSLLVVTKRACMGSRCVDKADQFKARRVPNV